MIINLIDSDSDFDKISSAAFCAAKRTPKPACRPLPQPPFILTPNATIRLTPQSLQVLSHPSSTGQADNAYIRQSGIYKMTVDQLRADIDAIDVRENQIRISVAHQQARLRATDPETQE
jgi:hypothetical protein